MKTIIKLIKSDIPADQIVKDDRKIHSERVEGVGTFFYKISRTATPEWVSKFFLDRLACSQKLKSASAAGVLIVTREYGGGHRTFAVTFGSGRYILRDDVTEPRFGLRIALNSIQFDSLRSLDYNKMDGVPSIVRNQVSRLSGIENFDIDTHVNLLKSITGNPPDERQEDIGSSMTGSDSLALNSSVTVNGILAKLDQLYELYKSETYKLHFAWVDNIEAISDNIMTGRLDQRLFEKINSRQTENIWMAIPSIVDWTGIQYFKFSGRGSAEYDDISLDSVLREKFDDRNDLRPVEFKTASIKSYNSDDVRLNEWTLYKCLYAEMREGDYLYLLNDGSWYKIEANFYAEVERAYNSVAASQVGFVPWRLVIRDEKERFELEKDYNKRLADSNVDYCDMDCEYIRPVPGQSKIEFCDVFTKGGMIIHVKRKGGSELLGHMLNQGRVSGELLMTEDFRRKLNEQLAENRYDDWQLPESNDDFRANRYSIVFAVMSKEDNDRPSMPFFSKVILRDTVKSLRAFGYQVYLNNIRKE